MKGNGLLVAAALGTLLSPAHAGLLKSGTSGQLSYSITTNDTQLGTSDRVNLDSLAPSGSYAVNNSGAVKSATNDNPIVAQGSAGGVGYTLSGGGLFNTSTAGISGVSARPAESTGTWYSLAATVPSEPSPGNLYLSEGVSYFSFLWGSPDTYNSVNFYDSDNRLLGTLTGTALGASQSWTEADYVSVWGPRYSIRRVEFISTQAAFEISDMSFKVPEPGVPHLIVLGAVAAALGSSARRNKTGK